MPTEPPDDDSDLPPGGVRVRPPMSEWENAGPLAKAIAVDPKAVYGAADRVLHPPRTGRPPGPVKRGKAERWVRRGLETDYGTAYAEFKAETIETEGSWTPKDYQWWYRHVRPRLLQKPR
jgi:hypothetical protein